jgi:hypothetical protein
MTHRDTNTRPSNQNLNRLIPRLNEQLLGYAAAASAAGVGLLALAQPAEAKIIFTASDIPIVQNAGGIQIDLNHDGIADFSFSSNCFGANCISHDVQHHLSPSGFTRRALTVGGLQASNGAAEITFQGHNCAAEAGKGHKVGAGLNFQQGPLPLNQGSSSSAFTKGSCEWGNSVGNLSGFLGLKFVVNGQTYYGWAHIVFGDWPTVRGYAYEDTPDTPILTGATSGPVKKSDAAPLIPFPSAAQLPSLGLLAKGAPGLAIWRRAEELAWRRPEEVAAN